MFSVTEIIWIALAIFLVGMGIIRLGDKVLVPILMRILDGMISVLNRLPKRAH